MQNDKLRVGFVKSMGVKFGIGDCIKNEGSSAVLGTDWVEMANSTKKISDDWFVESFAPRKNTGEQPCDDDVPVVLEYYRNHKDFGNEKRYAGQVDWACVTTNKSWKPDINELIKLQDAHDKQAKPKRTKVEFVKVDKNANNGKYWECARQFAEGECEFFTDGNKDLPVTHNDCLLANYKAGLLFRKVEREVTWQDELKIDDAVIYNHYASGKCNAKVIGIYKDFVWLELNQPVKEKVSFKHGNIHCCIEPMTDKPE